MENRMNDRRDYNSLLARLHLDNLDSGYLEESRFPQSPEADLDECLGDSDERRFQYHWNTGTKSYEWYLRTREGSMGPYRSLEAARFKLEALKSHWERMALKEASQFLRQIPQRCDASDPDAASVGLLDSVASPSAESRRPSRSEFLRRFRLTLFAAIRGIKNDTK